MHAGARTLERSIHCTQCSKTSGPRPLRLARLTQPQLAEIGFNLTRLVAPKAARTQSLFFPFTGAGRPRHAACRALPAPGGAARLQQRGQLPRRVLEHAARPDAVGEVTRHGRGAVPCGLALRGPQRARASADRRAAPAACRACVSEPDTSVPADHTGASCVQGRGAPGARRRACLARELSTSRGRPSAPLLPHHDVHGGVDHGVAQPAAQHREGPQQHRGALAHAPSARSGAGRRARARLPRRHPAAPPARSGERRGQRRSLCEGRGTRAAKPRGWRLHRAAGTGCATRRASSLPRAGARPGRSAHPPYPTLP